MAETWVDGADRLYANMDKCVEQVQEAAQKGLLKAGMRIVADAQRNIRTAGYNGGTLTNTGQLANSGKTQALPDGTIETGFFSSSGSRGYAAAVEYGSRPHWAPVDMIRAWAKKKLRVPDKEVNTVAYFVNRSIHRKGTRPHAFFQPAVKKNEKAVAKAISNAIAEVTKRDQ